MSTNKKYLVGNFKNTPQLYQYYTKCKEYRHKIKEIIGKSVSKYNIKNVWNQWILRVLGREAINYHLLASRDSVEADRDETLKHIILKPNEDPQDANETYDEIVNYCDKIHQQYNNFKANLMADPQLIREICQNIQILDHYSPNESSKKTQMTIHYKLDNKKFNKLQDQYDRHQSNPNLFKFYLFELIHNYSFIEGNTHQWSVPPVVMKLLKNKFHVQNELFASPINHFFQDYFSLFEIDKLFGSKGNALNYDILPDGCYEVNPPFVEETMEKVSQTMVKSLQKSSKENKLQFFFFVIPWKDCSAFKLMTNREFLIDNIQLDREEHFYYEPEFNRFNKAKFYTQLILVGTQKAKDIYTDDIRRTIVSNFQRNRNH